MAGAFRAIAVLAQALTQTNRDKLLRLWAGDTGDYDSQSEADLAFCTILARHTDDDLVIDQLMRLSGLMREKWDAPRGRLPDGGQETYGEQTIAKAREFSESAGEEATSGARGGRRQSQATVLISLAQASGAVFWHDPDGEAYATVTVSDHHENWRLRSKQFRDYLARLFYQQEKKAAGSQALQDALNTLAGMARFEGTEHAVHVRIAEHESAVYLDLGDPEWRAVKITAAGWAVVASGSVPVKFRRPKGMLPLPEPVRGGTYDGLRDLLNLRDDGDFMLILGWLVATLRGRGPFPVLDLSGEQGSAKTTAARSLRRTVDPNKAPLRAEPRDERDLAIAASNSLIVGFDNLSYIPPWLSDALCRVATGGGFGTRTLYENDEETLFDFTRPIIFTAIVEAAVRGDLLDRALTVNLPPVEKRRTEADIESAFLSTWPGTLGALLDAVSTALRNLPTTKLDRLPRMADFALWVEAAAPAFGWEPGAFLTAYEANRETANEIAMEASPLATVLKTFVESQPNGEWKGTASDLLHRLNTMHAAAGTQSQRGWPKAAHVLSGQLKRLAPNLRKAGIAVEFGIKESDGTAHGTRRVIIVSYRPEKGHTTASGASKRPDKTENRADQPKPPDASSASGNPTGRPGSVRKPAAKKPVTMPKTETEPAVPDTPDTPVAPSPTSSNGAICPNCGEPALTPWHYPDCEASHTGPHRDQNPFANAIATAEVAP